MMPITVEERNQDNQPSPSHLRHQLLLLQSNRLLHCDLTEGVHAHHYIGLFYSQLVGPYTDLYSIVDNCGQEGGARERVNTIDSKY